MSHQAPPPSTDETLTDGAAAPTANGAAPARVALLSAHPNADALYGMLHRVAASEGASFRMVEDEALAELCLVTDEESLPRVPVGCGAVAFCAGLDVRFVDPARFLGAVVPFAVHRGALVTAGFAPSQVRVAFVGAPFTWSDEAERDVPALPPELLPGAPHVVVVSADVADEGMALWLQLSLVSSKVAFFFDVGADEVLAASLRHRLPALHIDAFLMSSGDPASIAVYRAASVVVCRVFDPALLAALSCDAHAIVATPSLREQPVLDALSASGRAEALSSYSTLAVQLDALFASRTPSEEAVADKSVPSLFSPAQLVGAIEHFVAQRRRPRAAVQGLERVSTAHELGPTTNPVSRNPDALGPHAPTPGTPTVDPVDAELAALRAKLGL